MQINKEHSEILLHTSQNDCHQKNTNNKCWQGYREKGTSYTDPNAGKDEGQKKRVTEDEMVGWQHQINGHEFEQTPGDSEGQRSLAYCSPWGSQRVRHN